VGLRRALLSTTPEKISVWMDLFNKVRPATASPMNTTANMMFSVENPVKQMFKMIKILSNNEEEYEWNDWRKSEDEVWKKVTTPTMV